MTSDDISTFSRLSRLVYGITTRLVAAYFARAEEIEDEEDEEAELIVSWTPRFRR